MYTNSQQHKSLPPPVVCLHDTVSGKKAKTPKEIAVMNTAKTCQICLKF